jgi:hypothetical protein
MQSSHWRNAALWIVWGTATAGCNVSTQTPGVEFGAAQPVGHWAAEAAAGSGSAAGSPAIMIVGDPNPITGGAAGRLSAAGSGGALGVAGRAAAGVGGSIAGSSGKAAGAGGNPAGQAGAGAAGSGGSSSPGGGATSLAFDVTTSPVGGRYQPKNIGAIWVQDSSGKLVKSLEVWAGVRRRYLTAYSTALAGGTVDVTASATLASHRAHHATWDMKNRSGAAAPPGTYTLVMELTDGDMTGRSNKLTFDTSAGATSMTPADAPSFASMKLQLQ